MICYLIDKLAFGAGLLAGFQIPKFAADFEQQVGGRLAQARLDLAPFQAIADRLHGGSLEALVAKHLASTDPTFHAEGSAIRALADHVSSLARTVEELEGGFVDQLAHLLLRADGDAVRSTWAAFEPGLVFDVEALACAVAVALLASLLVHAAAAGTRRWSGNRLQIAGNRHDTDL